VTGSLVSGAGTAITVGGEHSARGQETPNADANPSDATTVKKNRWH
jgi:hypothetical protein